MSCHSGPMTGTKMMRIQKPDLSRSWNRLIDTARPIHVVSKVTTARVATIPALRRSRLPSCTAFRPARPCPE